MIFKEFLENKNGKWDYIDDDLMNLSKLWNMPYSLSS